MGIARTVVGDAFMLHFLWRREEGEKEPRGREPDDEAPAQRSALHMANAPQSTVCLIRCPDRVYNTERTLVTTISRVEVFG